MRKMNYFVFSLVLVLVFVLTACKQNSQEPSSTIFQKTDSSTVESPATIEQSQRSTEVSATDLSPVGSEVQDQIKTTVPGNEEQTTHEVVAPTPRPDMEATDPSRVVLASGDIQLVEFFAFW